MNIKSQFKVYGFLVKDYGFKLSQVTDTANIYKMYFIKENLAILIAYGYLKDVLDVVYLKLIDKSKSDGESGQFEARVAKDEDVFNLMYFVRMADSKQNAFITSHFGEKRKKEESVTKRNVLLAKLMKKYTPEIFEGDLTPFRVLRNGKCEEIDKKYNHDLYKELKSGNYYERMKID